MLSSPTQIHQRTKYFVTPGELPFLRLLGSKVPGSDLHIHTGGFLCWQCPGSDDIKIPKEMDSTILGIGKPGHPGFL